MSKTKDEEDYMSMSWLEAAQEEDKKRNKEKVKNLRDNRKKKKIPEPRFLSKAKRQK